MVQRIGLLRSKHIAALGEVKETFHLHFAQGCRRVMQRVYEKVLAVGFERFINAGRYERTEAPEPADRTSPGSKCGITSTNKR